MSRQPPCQRAAILIRAHVRSTARFKSAFRMLRHAWRLRQYSCRSRLMPPRQPSRLYLRLRFVGGEAHQPRIIC